MLPRPSFSFNSSSLPPHKYTDKVMAKLGKGDKCWIVEDLSDGTNLHNWHWFKTEWSRNLLCNLYCNKPLLSGEGNLNIKIKKIEKLD
ncbi:hypothetical protein CASFOL_016204 [Castilleja foliolosa]|uniref:Uncharacterized protein n=1 Tax=Castilleja foliolosa TaxID=1961234 RepID=A0ABD3DHX6_9LAMI